MNTQYNYKTLKGCLKLKIKNLINVSLALCIFCFINLPSIKIFVHSSIINVLTMIGICAVGLIKVLFLGNGKLIISKTKIKFIMLFGVLWIILFFISLISSTSNLAFFDFFQYLVIILGVLGILLFSTHKEVSLVIILQITWGVILAVLQLTLEIDLNRDFGQHYLTLGVPLAAAIVSIFGLLLHSTSIVNKIILISCGLLLILGISTLIGRSPIILSTITIILFVILRMVVLKSFKSKFKLLSVIIVLIPGMLYLISKNVSEHWMQRFQNLSNMNDEPRIDIYIKAIDAIKNNIFGYGLNSSPYFGFNYPHNIFLEIIISGGIFSLISMLIILILTIASIWKSLYLDQYAFSIALVTTYFFLTWNLSFDLSSSYIPFSTIALLLTSSEEVDKKGELKEMNFASDY